MMNLIVNIAHKVNKVNNIYFKIIKNLIKKCIKADLHHNTNKNNKKITSDKEKIKVNNFKFNKFQMLRRFKIIKMILRL